MAIGLRQPVRQMVLILSFSTVAFQASDQASARALLPSEIGSSIEERISVTIDQMTLEEKVSLLGGVEAFNTRPIEQHGIPQLKMADGPVGVRLGRSTAFPSGIALGATFDPELAHEMAAAIADEARFKGRNVLLGPCVNISRQPFGGRNFESFGEDPFLAGQLAASYVRGIQSQNVLASVKHLAANDQEENRLTIDVKVDPRALFEIHLPAFKAAVDAGSWTVMSAYNRINGHYASENDFLQNQVLKKRWGFKGFVVSDWGATHSTVAAANHGLDLEMPGPDHFNADLIEAVKRGQVLESTIDDKVRRILRSMYAIGLVDPTLVKVLPKPEGPESRRHKELARRIAENSTVLLKNNDAILPLNPSSVRSIAVLGPNAASLRTGGGGSSQVEPTSAVSPLEAMKAEFASRNVKVVFSQGVVYPSDPPELIPDQNLRPDPKAGVNGVVAEYFANTGLSGKPSLVRREANFALRLSAEMAERFQNDFSVRWTGYVFVPKTGTYQLETLSDDGVRLFVNDQKVIDNWTDHSSVVDRVSLNLNGGQWYLVRLEYYQKTGAAEAHLGWKPPGNANSFENAVLAAKNADVAVIFAGLGMYYEGEGVDRKTMDLPQEQVALIEAVAKVNPNTVVVLYSGNPVTMQPWLNSVKAVIQSWYPGQEGGWAIARVLSGMVNPSGKLPVTFLKRWEDSPAYGNYPGANGVVRYEEGVFVGYRHFDAKNIEPNFPFGFGLSYTRFAFSNLKAQIVDSRASDAKIKVSFDITNTGNQYGAEVGQIYVSELNPTVARPPRELRGFKKVSLAPGKTATLAVTLDASAFAYFDATLMDWKVNPGLFQIAVGSSSRELPLLRTIRLK